MQGDDAGTRDNFAIALLHGAIGMKRFPNIGKRCASSRATRPFSNLRPPCANDARRAQIRIYGDYIYIVAWSDDNDYQGTVASFKDTKTGTTITTSANSAWPWQVFATGVHINGRGVGQPGPDLTGSSTAINNEIATANNNNGVAGTTSVGWVGVNGDANGSVANGSLYFGGTGTLYNHFNYPNAVPDCIGSGAHWMEYDPEPYSYNCDPFHWGYRLSLHFHSKLLA